MEPQSHREHKVYTFRFFTCIDSTIQHFNHSTCFKVLKYLAIQADLTMIDAFNRLIKPLEGQIEKIAYLHDPNNLYLLKTIPGVGLILALTILYEVHDIRRFKTVQRFCSYARLIRPEKESDGKWAGKSNKKSATPT